MIWRRCCPAATDGMQRPDLLQAERQRLASKRTKLRNACARFALVVFSFGCDFVLAMRVILAGPPKGAVYPPCQGRPSLAPRAASIKSARLSEHGHQIVVVLLHRGF
jgi:hypothetical protein